MSVANRASQQDFQGWHSRKRAVGADAATGVFKSQKCYTVPPDTSDPSCSGKLGFSCQGRGILHVRENPKGVLHSVVGEIKVLGPHTSISGSKWETSYNFEDWIR